MEDSEAQHLLFVCHGKQIPRYACLASHLKERWRVSTTAWVTGDRDLRSAEEAGFDKCVNLLSGSKDDRGSSTPLARISEFESEHAGFRFHRDTFLDRHLRRKKWSRARLAGYADQMIGAVEDAFRECGSEALLVFGENNRLHHRIIGGVVGTTPYLTYASARHWNGRMFWTENQSFRWRAATERYEEFLASGVPESLQGRCEEKLDEIRSFRRKPAYFGNSPDEDAYMGAIIEAVREFGEALGNQEHRVNPNRRTPLELSPPMRLGNALRKHKSIREYRETSKERKPNDSYACYFLHHEPEHVVDYVSFPYRDQEYMIETIAATLPAQTPLVVKENPKTLGDRDEGFYRRLANIPGVELVSTSVDSHVLIENASLITTLAGSVALEAMYYRVPAIVFAPIFFAKFGGIHHVRHLKELKTVVQQVLSGDSSSVASESQIVAALAAMYDASTQAVIGPHYRIEEIDTEENLRRLEGSLLPFLPLEKGTISGR